MPSSPNQQQQPEHSVICCKRCSKPLFPFSSVLPQKIDVWSDTVYTYQLEDVLPDHGVEGGCHLYSATNPGQRRFDVFRVRVCDDEEQKQEKWSKDITVNIDTRARGYSSEHSWFPNYDWTFCECSNCNNHVGWGFAPKEEKQEKTDDGDDDEKKTSARTSPRIPVFMGCIFANIISKEMSKEDWDDYIKLRSSVTHKIRLNLLRSSWPALKDQLRVQIMTFITSLLLKYDSDVKNAKEEEESTKDKHEQKQAASAKAALRQFHGIILRLENLLTAADSFICRLREKRRQEGNNNNNNDDDSSTATTMIEHNSVPYFREEIDISEYKLEPCEDIEDVAQEGTSDEDDTSFSNFEVKAIELIRGFHSRWKDTVAAAEEEQKKRQREREQQEDAEEQSSQQQQGQAAFSGGASGIMNLFRALLAMGNRNNNNAEENEAAHATGDLDEYIDPEDTEDDEEEDYDEMLLQDDDDDDDEDEEEVDENPDSPDNDLHDEEDVEVESEK